jgi:O-antigen ligase
MSRYTSLAVFLFSSIALIVPSGFSVGASLLFLGGLCLLAKRPRLGLDREDYLLMGVLTLYFTVNSLNNFSHGAPASEYDPPLRFVLAIPALLLLLAYPPKPSALWGGIAIGAIGAGLYSVWILVMHGEPRPSGTTNPIQYGNISFLLSIFCPAGLAWAQTQRRQAAWTALLVLGAAFGLLASLLTGSRGSWLALPICIVIVLLNHVGSQGKRNLYLGLCGLVALVVVMVAMPNSSMRARSELAVEETEAYVNQGNANTSVGQRLEMWRSGIAMVPGHLVLGWGKQGYLDNKHALIAAGKIAPAIGDHTHLHNEYLDALVKRGIPGLLVLLALYITLLRLFMRHLKDSSHAARPYAVCGVMLMTCYILFGLTQAFLTHNNGVMTLVFFTIIFWSYLRSHRRAAVPTQGDARVEASHGPAAAPGSQGSRVPPIYQ